MYNLIGEGKDSKVVSNSGQRRVSNDSDIA